MVAVSKVGGVEGDTRSRKAGKAECVSEHAVHGDGRASSIYGHETVV